jgi:hypothetical protein
MTTSTALTTLAALDPSKAGPGLLGFVVMFGLALAVLLLVRSMAKHLRKVRYAVPPDEVVPPDDAVSPDDAAPTIEPSTPEDAPQS